MTNNAINYANCTLRVSGLYIIRGGKSVRLMKVGIVEGNGLGLVFKGSQAGGVGDRRVTDCMYLDLLVHILFEEKELHIMVQ